MVTHGLFPRLGLDHCVRSELSPELEQGLEADAVQDPAHTALHGSHCCTHLPIPRTHWARKYTQRTLDTGS